MRILWIGSLILGWLASVIGCSRVDDSDRLTVVNSSVQLLSVQSQQPVTQQGLTMKLVATVTPPAVQLTTVQANSFWLQSDIAYIAYNNAGLPVVGAIDVVDLSTPTNPRLTSQLSFPTQKINGLVVNQNTLFYTGSSSDVRGAVIGKIGLSDCGHLGIPSAPVQLPSYAGTGIVARGDTFYATSGDTGDLSLLDASLNVKVTVPEADARGVAMSPDGKTVGVVRGQPGTVALFDAKGSTGASYNLGGASIAESKSTIQMGARLTLASLGDGGFAIICTQNGAIVAQQSAVTIADASADMTVTNAASAGDGLVFTANGSAGVYMYQLSQGSVMAGTNCTADSLTLLGYLDLGAFSANMVYFHNNYLFVADGLGGFRIIAVQNASAATGGDNDFANPGTGLVALNATADGALNLVGNASLNVNGGFVYVDSSSSKALTATGNATVSADATFVTGSDRLTGNASISGSLVLGSTPLSDPLAWLPVPAATGLSVVSTAAVTVTSNSVQTLNPGIYQKGIALSGNAQVTLSPGVYYLADGGLSLSGNASLTGSGILIYNASTSAGISITGNGTVSLTPATTGTYAGVTVFQNRASTAAVTIGGNGNLDIRGTLYVAQAPLTLTGNGAAPTLGSLDVADRVTITGNGSVALSQ